MSRNLCFTYLDGREIAAASPRELLEALRTGDTSAAEDLGHYLDLLWIRGELTFAIVLNVGAPGDDLDLRCRKALASLIHHGWLRVKRPEATWPPRERRCQEIGATVGSLAVA